MKRFVNLVPLPQNDTIDTFDSYTHLLSQLDEIIKIRELFICTRNRVCKCDGPCMCDSDLYVPITINVTDTSNNTLILNIQSTSPYIKKHTKVLRIFSIVVDKEVAHFDIRCGDVSYLITNPLQIVASSNGWYATVAINYMIYKKGAQ